MPIDRRDNDIGGSGRAPAILKSTEILPRIFGGPDQIDFGAARVEFTLLRCWTGMATGKKYR
jgi:hypothetical protein